MDFPPTVCHGSPARGQKNRSRFSFPLGLWCFVLATAAHAQQATTGTKEWPMWGRTPARNMVGNATKLPTDFDVKSGKGLLWKAKLGSQAYGNPVVAGGKIFVGTNNEGGYRPSITGDKGILLAFDAVTGKFLWQLTRDKLPQGGAVDWPEQGIASSPCVIGNRVYVVTNRCELLCLDTEGFTDGKNDGVVVDEVEHDGQAADIIWSLDMFNALGVRPHNLANSSPTVYENVVLIFTSNGVNETKDGLPAPDAPSFLGVDKDTGKVLWQDNSPGKNIIDGQWSSPAVGIVNGKPQAYFGGGDGWLYALDPLTGKHLWKFDLNPKEAKHIIGGRGERNAVVATPVFHDNSVIVGVGQDPDHGEGTGHLYRIDASKSGDVTASAQIWHYGGKTPEGEFVFRRTLSTVAVENGLVYAADLSGFLHCLDWQTGKKYWAADLLAAVWGSPVVLDGKVWIGDEDGELAIFEAGKTESLIAELPMLDSMFGAPVFANGVLYIATRTTLYAIKATP